MRKTLSLLGLLLTGLMLLANPTTGILATTDTDPEAAVVVTSTTLSGDPPNDSDEDDVVSVAETTTAAEVTTTTEATTTTESTAEATGSFSVVGSTEESRFGTFQVEVFFEDGEIVAVEALQLPTDRKSNSINSRAVSAYEEAVIAAQSADIDVISGATVTWDNYTASLQSALDEVGFVA